MSQLKEANPQCFESESSSSAHVSSCKPLQDLGSGVQDPGDQGTLPAVNVGVVPGAVGLDRVRHPQHQSPGGHLVQGVVAQELEEVHEEHHRPRVWAGLEQGGDVGDDLLGGDGGVVGGNRLVDPGGDGVDEEVCQPGPDQDGPSG